ncbi:hypothetical protein VDS42_18990 [Xanthomonas campestris pv. campestris]|nr:hypothetical protein [Xanthomonas campestris pv. campestris]
MTTGLAGELPAAAKHYEPAYVYKGPRSKYWRCQSLIDVDVKNDGAVRQFKTRERAQKRCDELNAGFAKHRVWLRLQPNAIDDPSDQISQT